MRVAITGSHGFIGSALAASLRDDGHEVVPIARDGITADALRGSDAVVHLAGESIGGKRWSDEQKRKVLESRTTTTTQVSEAIASLDDKPRVLVSGSAVGYYGDRGSEILTEESGPGDIFLSEVCIAWEGATKAAEDAGIRVAHIRTGIVVGKGGGAMAKTMPLFNLGLGGKFGRGQQWWSLISLEDEVGAIRFVIDQDVRGPVNLTSPEPVTNARFTKLLGGTLHRPTFLSVPAFGPRLLLGRELADQLLFSSQRAEPRVLTDAGYRFRHPDAAAVLSTVV